jgi:hypothetical protein
MVDRKGLVIAQHVCKELGLKLIMAGPGNNPKIEYGEWVGPVGHGRTSKVNGRCYRTLCSNALHRTFR